jgi:hypothetical protein
LYGTVLDAALSNPCLFKSSSAEARAAGAEQLARQLALDKAAGLLLPFPERVQHQVDKNNRQYIGSQKGAAAVIGGLLGDVGKHLDLIETPLDEFTRGIEQVQSHLQPPQQAVQQLQQLASDLDRVIDQGAQLWVDLRENSSSSSNYSDSDSEQLPEKDSTLDPEAVQIAAHRRWRWVLNAEVRLETPLGALMQRWADAVCAALPSRHCCSNPCCVVLREMSESNLVNGKACCCGGCSAADQAVRYCSRDCQVSHWQQHKALCRSRRKQQQQQQ